MRRSEILFMERSFSFLERSNLQTLFGKEGEEGMKIEAGKRYRTREGKLVRIYAIDGSLPQNAHGAIKEKDGWHSNEWSTSGEYFPYGVRTSPDDLVREVTE